MTTGDQPSPGRIPNPVDRHVGSRVRMRRTLLGMSQERLGEALGLTFQQVQKYEKGTNRIGASRLNQIAKILADTGWLLLRGRAARFEGVRRTTGAARVLRHRSRQLHPRCDAHA